MGQYFGIKKCTHKQAVSSFWKNAPPTVKDLEKISAILQWDLNNDFIISSSYCSSYTWKDNNFVEDDFGDSEDFGDFNEVTGISTDGNDPSKDYILFDQNGNPTTDKTFFFG